MFLFINKKFLATIAIKYYLSVTMDDYKKESLFFLLKEEIELEMNFKTTGMVVAMFRDRGMMDILITVLPTLSKGNKLAIETVLKEQKVL